MGNALASGLPGHSNSLVTALRDARVKLEASRAEQSSPEELPPGGLTEPPSSSEGWTAAFALPVEPLRALRRATNLAQQSSGQCPLFVFAGTAAADAAVLAVRVVKYAHRTNSYPILMVTGMNASDSALAAALRSAGAPFSIAAVSAIETDTPRTMNVRLTTRHREGRLLWRRVPLGCALRHRLSCIYWPCAKRCHRFFPRETPAAGRSAWRRPNSSTHWLTSLPVRLKRCRSPFFQDAMVWVPCSHATSASHPWIHSASASHVRGPIFDTPRRSTASPPRWTSWRVRCLFWVTASSCSASPAKRDSTSRTRRPAMPQPPPSSRC